MKKKKKDIDLAIKNILLYIHNLEFKINPYLNYYFMYKIIFIKKKKEFIIIQSVLKRFKQALIIFFFT